MIRHSTRLVALALILALVTGCAGTSRIAQREAAGDPLQLSYDIQYVDNTAISVELMVLSPDLPYRQGVIERSLDRAMGDVARDLPKSHILARQIDFRNALQASFRKATGKHVQASLFVMNVCETGVRERTTQVSMK